MFHIFNTSQIILRNINKFSFRNNNEKIKKFFQSSILAVSVKKFHLNSFKCQCSTRPFDVNTKVVKDVVMFKYENPKFYKVINIFAICQFLFWNYLAHFAFTTLKDAPVDRNTDKDLAWWRRINLGENKYRNTITVLCFLVGYGILAACWGFTLRSVRFLILRKGGDQVTFVTYTPFGKNRMITVPINCISAQESRLAARVQLPIKIKNKSFYYILDKKGEFTNGKLFDNTAGLRRKL